MPFDDDDDGNYVYSDGDDEAVAVAEEDDGEEYEDDDDDDAGIVVFDGDDDDGFGTDDDDDNSSGGSNLSDDDDADLDQDDADGDDDTYRNRSEGGAASSDDASNGGGGGGADTAYPQTHTFVPISLPEFVACTSMRTQMLAHGAPTTLSADQKAVLLRELRCHEGESMQHWDEVRMLAEWRLARMPIQSLRKERDTDVGTLVNANNVGDMLAFRPRHDWALLATHLWVLQIPDPIMSHSPQRDARILI